MSIIFVRPRGRKRQDPDASKGRLAVGWRIQDWTLVYYEPITTANADEDVDKVDNEGAAEIGPFRFDSPHGPPAYREPMKGEVAWLPHFDPARFPSTSGRERDLMQKRFLGDAYAYCVARGPVEEEALVKRLTDDKYRKWASWFEMAQKWKKGDRKQRRQRRKEREETVISAGRPLEEVEMNSDSSGDSGVEDVHDMPPPPRPNKRKGNGGRANGHGPSAKRGRNGSNGAGSSSNGSSRNRSGLYMSGGLGGRDPSRAGTAFGGSVGGDDDDDHDDRDWSSHHPSPDPDSAPFPGPRGPNGLDGGGGASVLEANGVNGFPTPNSFFAQTHRVPPDTPNGLPGSRPTETPKAPPRPRGRSHTSYVPFSRGSPCDSMQPDDESGGANDDNLIVTGTRQVSVRPDNEPAGGNGGVEGPNVAEYNGENIDEEEAFQWGLRASVVPPDDVDDDVQRAIRASMEPGDNGSGQRSGEPGLPNGVQPSIESGEDESETRGGT
ncbi:hypothetical protein B0A55_06978 [Friedmanniomyces simplex]|uniref:Uncharacterized protein n=1 Tax=Friedmanniomyces simplex TaxID=329884 RepID=A0A4U0X6J0_9PEZI|nr:hypothetical protein B0A55_06978 [Friedmanniomyces simplex]